MAKRFFSTAPQERITALAIDSAGNIYAAAAEKAPRKRRAANDHHACGSAQKRPARRWHHDYCRSHRGRTGDGIPAPGAGVTGGSEIYRIAPDGAPSRMWSSREDLVYALGFISRTPSGRTGNRVTFSPSNGAGAGAETGLALALASTTSPI